MFIHFEASELMGKLVFRSTNNSNTIAMKNYEHNNLTVIILIHSYLNNDILMFLVAPSQ